MSNHHGNNFQINMHYIALFQVYLYKFGQI